MGEDRGEGQGLGARERGTGTVTEPLERRGEKIDYRACPLQARGGPSRGLKEIPKTEIDIRRRIGGKEGARKSFSGPEGKGVDRRKGGRRTLWGRKPKRSKNRELRGWRRRKGGAHSGREGFAELARRNPQRRLRGKRAQKGSSWHRGEERSSNEWGDLKRGEGVMRDSYKRKVDREIRQKTNLLIVVRQTSSRPSGVKVQGKRGIESEGELLGRWES